MTQITWKNSYSVNIPSIDEQHKELITVLNELYEASKNGMAQTILAAILEKLTKYSITHFQYEENLMEKHGFDKIEEHKDEHRKFIEQLQSFTGQAAKGNLILSLKTIDFLKDWLINHTLGTDHDYSEFLVSKGVS